MVEGRLVEDEDVGERCADEVKNDTKEPGGGVSAGVFSELDSCLPNNQEELNELALCVVSCPLTLPCVFCRRKLEIFRRWFPGPGL